MSLDKQPDLQSEFLHLDESINIGDNNINSMMLNYWTSLTTLLLIMGDSTMAEQERSLTIMLVASFGQFGFNSSGIVPAADLALENINNDPGILKGYRLTYGNVWDSQVSYTKKESFPGPLSHCSLPLNFQQATFMTLKHWEWAWDMANSCPTVAVVTFNPERDFYYSG